LILKSPNRICTWYLGNLPTTGSCCA
jgi:hypothetical protein